VGPAKLTREEKKAQTRERLIDAAARLFGERGFAGASLDDVAEEAGLTKGAVYSNFASKEDLIQAVLDERLEPRLMGVAAVAHEPRSTDDRIREAGRRFGEVLEQEQSLSLLAFEYMIQAARDPALAARFRDRNRAALADLADLVEREWAEAAGCAPSVPADVLAAGLRALANGFALEKAADPDGTDDEVFGIMITLIYAGMAVPPADP
jgi:AcrR family transcriptional regulator